MGLGCDAMHCYYVTTIEVNGLIPGRASTDRVLLYHAAACIYFRLESIEYCIPWIKHPRNIHIVYPVPLSADSN